LLFVPQIDLSGEQPELLVWRQQYSWVEKDNKWSDIISMGDVKAPDRIRADLPGDKNASSEWWNISCGYSELGDDKKWSAKVMAGERIAEKLGSLTTRTTYPVERDVVRTLSGLDNTGLDGQKGSDGTTGFGYFHRTLTVISKTDLPSYRFVTAQRADRVLLSLSYGGIDRGGFEFDGQGLRVASPWVPPPSYSTRFHYRLDDTLHSLQSELLAAPYPEARDWGNYGRHRASGGVEPILGKSYIATGPGAVHGDRARTAGTSCIVARLPKPEAPDRPTTADAVRTGSPTTGYGRRIANSG